MKLNRLMSSTYDLIAYGITVIAILFTFTIGIEHVNAGELAPEDPQSPPGEEGPPEGTEPSEEEPPGEESPGEPRSEEPEDPGTPEEPPPGEEGPPEGTEPPEEEPPPGEEEEPPPPPEEASRRPLAPPGEPRVGNTVPPPPSDESTTGLPTIFQSTTDGFQVQVPDGWIIHDMDNTNSALSEELRKGYGILAQLCPEEEEQDAVVPATTTTVSNVGGSSDNTLSCEGSESEVIHIIRYPEPDNNNRTLAADNTTTAIPISSNSTITDDSILSYQLKKLQEIGYSEISILHNTTMTINVIDSDTTKAITTVPAKRVEMTYSTASTPNESRVGYLISTGTELTQPNLGTTKGYGVFYEGNSSVTTTPGEITTAAASLPLPPAIEQVFDSFELIAAPEAAENGEDDEE